MTGLRLPQLPLLAIVCLSAPILCCLVPCVALYIEQASVATGRASPARPKDDFSLRDLVTVTTASGLPTLERLASLSLPSGKLLLLLNSCSGADAHDPTRPPLDQQVFFGCDVNLQQIDPSDSWRRSQLQLIGSAEFPEVRGVGVWGQEGKGKLEKVLLLFWSATCPTKEKTCRCNNSTGCGIKFDNGSSSSCLASLYEGKLAPQGARFCQGTDPVTSSSSSSSCYYYKLEERDGWACGSDSAEAEESAFFSSSRASGVTTWEVASQDSWERHGVRLGSSPGVRYGALFLAEFDGLGKQQWVKRLAEDVAIFYGQEQRAAIVGGDAAVSTGGLKRQYAVTVTRERWEEKGGKLLVFPHCETILLNTDGEREKEELPGKECESCLYTSASVHPETHLWASLCISSRLPKLGISINGQLAVDSSNRFKQETQDIDALDESRSYYKDTGGRLLPVRDGQWVLIWREASWQVAETEGLIATSATLKAGVWDEKGSGTGVLARPVSLMSPLLEGRLRDLDAVSLSLDTAVVTAADYLSQEAVAAAVDLAKLSIRGPTGRVAIAGVQSGALFGRVYGHPLLRLSDVDALWLGAVRENFLSSVGPSLLLPDWGPIDLFRAVVITVEKGEEICAAQSANTALLPLSLLPLLLFAQL